MKRPYTQLENDTLEALARAPFSPREFRVVLAILRLTNGYHLNENEVSIRYLQQLTGLAPNHLYATLKSLRGKQVISRDDEMVACHGPALWSFPQIAPASPSLGLESRSGTSSDSPEVGLSQIVPAPDRKPDSLKKTIKKTIKKTGADAPQKTREKKKPEGDPRVTEMMELVAKERGYGSPLYPAEAKASKWMLGQGHSPGDILACWRAMKRETYWASRELLLMSVQKEIGQWVKAGRRPDAFEKKGAYGEARGHPQEPWRGRVGRVATNEEFEQLAKELGQEPDPGE